MGHCFAVLLRESLQEEQRSGQGKGESLSRSGGLLLLGPVFIDTMSEADSIIRS